MIDNNPYLNDILANDRRAMLLLAVTHALGSEALFYYAVKAYESSPTLSKARLIYDWFISPTAAFQLNINAKASKNVKTQLIAIETLIQSTSLIRPGRRMVNTGALQRGNLDLAKTRLATLFDAVWKEANGHNASFVIELGDFRSTHWPKRKEGVALSNRIKMKQCMDELALAGIII
jgi:hypothetical protein